MTGKTTTAKTADEQGLPTDEIGISGDQAARLREEFDTESELTTHLRQNKTIIDISGIHKTTSRRVNEWFKNNHPEARRTRIQNNNSMVAEFYEQSEQDGDEFQWGFVCSRCGCENPMEGNPELCKDRVFSCTSCDERVVLHTIYVTDFLEETVNTHAINTKQH